jgi:hypothetical protein
MRKLGEQWVEEIDGKEHMVKAVKQTNKCSGCVFCTSIWCADHNQSERDFDCMTMIIKDLGILNEDGCLPNCWGEYPVIECHSEVVVLWYCRTYGNVRCITAGCSTKQEAIDAWNRRA